MSSLFDSPPADPVLESVEDPLLRKTNVQLEMLRLDRIHPLVNGNKWFKLKLNLQAARQDGHETLLSFGGAYSNHLRALAAAARLAGMRSIGLVRGELVSPLNPVLGFARTQGMKLYPVSRGDYRRKQEADFVDALRARFGDFYLIPEGGSNEAGVKGCEEIVGLLESRLRTAVPGPAGRRILAVACGTGATLAGLVRGAGRRQLPVELLGIAVLKGGGFLVDEVAGWVGDPAPAPAWRIALDYHFGGYAKSDQRLKDFIAGVQERTGIPLEPVYTGKLLYGVYDLVGRGAIPPGSRIVCLHTGGVYQ